DDQKIHLRELWRTVRKRKWLIATITIVITTLVTIDMYRTKDTFQASTLIEIGKDMTTLGRPGSIYGDDYDPFYMVNIKTKMLMVKSHSLLEEVVKEKHLDQNPRFFQAGGKRSLWQALRSIGTKFGIKNTEQATPESEILTTELAGDDNTEEQQKRREACIAVLDRGLARSGEH